MSQLKIVLTIVGLSLVACGGKGGPAATSPTTAPPTSESNKPTAVRTASPMTLAAQLKAGAASFEENCAGCHGDKGQGKKKAPAVIGDTALPKAPLGKRKVMFTTAADVLSYISKTMPKDDKGGLAKADYAAVLAFILTNSGTELTTALDAAAAAKIVLNE